MSSRNTTIHIIVVTLMLTLSGCATTPGVSETDSDNDPFERVNRKIFKFNDVFDRRIATPVAKGYDRVVPPKVKSGVRNFFSNLSEPNTIVNDLLQGKVKQAARDTGRFLINTTAGLLGLIDVAKHLNLSKNTEDFGQTFAKWGIKDGPYLVLPFLGPSNLRDTAGLYPYYNYTQYLGYIDSQGTRWALGLTDAVSARADLLKASDILGVQLDPYLFLRELYRQRRLNQIYDGDPPLDEDF